jgi:hypothetical protein
LDLLVVRKLVYNCIVYFKRQLTDNMYHVGGDPRISKGCQAHIRRKVVVRDDAVMASTVQRVSPSIACRVYSFPPPAVWMCRVYPFPPPAGMDVQSVSQSFDCNVDVQGVFIYMFFFNAGMPDCPASGQSSSRMNKNADTGTSLVPPRNKGTQSGTGAFRYRTERPDVGMPMPSYGFYR